MGARCGEQGFGHVQRPLQKGAAFFGKGTVAAGMRVLYGLADIPELFPNRKRLVEVNFGG